MKTTHLLCLLWFCGSFVCTGCGGSKEPAVSVEVTDDLRAAYEKDEATRQEAVEAMIAEEKAEKSKGK